MKVYDITRPLFPGMTVWPGEQSVQLEQLGSIAEGNVSNTTRIHVGVHSGTHIDAPLHFIDGGKSVEMLDVQLFTGWVTVVDATSYDVIPPEVFGNRPIPAGDAVFFKTRYSARTLHEPFDTGYTGITTESAKLLLDSGVRVVGTDALSIESYTSTDYIVHKTLLGNEVLIVEGLMLQSIEAGRYRYACLPLLIAGADGAPTRVILFEEE